MSSAQDDLTLHTDASTEVTLSASRAGERPEPRVDLGRGTSVGRYVVLDVLGSGGMGVVYAAFDPELDRKIALKLVRAQDDRKRGATGAARLIREAQAMAKLHHENVIVVHDVGRFEDRVFIAMEYLDGGTFTRWSKSRARPWRETLDILLKAGEGLAAAHAAGIVHRDFKPDNILLGEDGRVRVLDFGLARSLTPSLELQAATTEEIGKSFDSLDVQLTATGARVGTPAYMSPEQHLSQACDARSDQFSFCVTAYLALYGQRPYAGETLPELTMNVLQGDLRDPPQGHGVPPWIEPILRRGLSRDPDERFASMRALLDALAIDVSARRRSRLRMAGIGLAGVAASGVAVAAVFFGQRPCRDGPTKIAEVWNDKAREAGRSAFGNSGHEGADTTWAETSAALDTYADAWASMYTEACRATRVDEEQSENLLDRRVQCLERRRAQLKTAVAVFADADVTVVERAENVVQRLDPVDDCGDIEALLAELDPPAAELRDRVADVVAALAEVGTLRTVARFEQADETVRSLADEVEALGYPPIRTEYLYYRTAVANDLGKFDEAEALAYETVEAAAISNHVSMAADAWISLAIIVGITRQDFDKIEPILHAASAAVARSGSPVHRARLLTTWGTIEIFRERWAEAEPRLEEAVQLFLEHSGPEALDTLEAQERLALVYHGQGRYDDAEPILHEVRQKRELVLRPGHPQIAQVLGNLARLYKAQGRIEDSLPLYQRSLEIFRERNGEEHPVVATAHHNLSNTLRSLERYDEAAEHLEAAAKIQDKLYGPQSEQAGHNTHARGLLLFAQGRNEEALATIENALEMWERTLGPDHTRIAYALTSQGRILHALGRDEEAVTALERALTLRATPDSAPPDEHATTKFELARILWEQGRDRDRAVKLASEAKALLLDVDHLERAEEISAWIRSRGE